MATCTHEIQTADTGNTPNTSGAFTPVVGDLLVCMIVYTDSTSEASVPTSSIAGNTFSLVNVIDINTANRLGIWIADQLIVSGEDISQTVSFAPADTATGTVIAVVAVAGMTKSGAAAIRQTADRGTQLASTTPFATFASSCLTGNVTIGCLGNFTNPAGMTPPTSWTEGAADTGYATPTTGFEYVFRDSGFTGTTITWGSNSATTWSTVIVELDTSSPAANKIVNINQAVKRAAYW